MLCMLERILEICVFSSQTCTEPNFAASPQRLHTYFSDTLEAREYMEVCCYVICVFQSWNRLKRLILLKSKLQPLARLFSLAVSHFTASLLSNDITFLFGSALPHLHALFLSPSCQRVFIGGDDLCLAASVSLSVFISPRESIQEYVAEECDTCALGLHHILNVKLKSEFSYFVCVCKNKL